VLVRHGFTPPLTSLLVELQKPTRVGKSKD
jgi:hypothetical protein